MTTIPTLRSSSAPQQIMSIPGVEFRRDRLVISRDLTPDLVQEIAAGLFLLEGSASWWWGDFLAATEAKHGSKYDAALKISALSYVTLRQAKWVCKSFPPDIRRPTFFTTHLEALSLCKGNVPEALKWLDMVCLHRWSISRLRREHAAATGGQEEDESLCGGSGKFDPVAFAILARRYWEGQPPVSEWEPERKQAFLKDFGWVFKIVADIQKEEV